MNHLKFRIDLEEETREKIRVWVNTEILDQNEWLKEMYEKKEVEICINLLPTGRPGISWKIYAIVTEANTRFPGLKTKRLKDGSETTLIPNPQMFKVGCPNSVFPWIEYKGLDDPEIKKYFKKEVF